MEGVKSVYLAEPKEVERITGCTVGCVSPFGHKNRIKTYFDGELLESEYLFFNPGSHAKTIRIRSRDMVKLIGNPILF
jgi:prolyl-tRNA editing enzyme YbaK/EbsC (Cys-tRNA(Pro) deacylase)